MRTMSKNRTIEIQLIKSAAQILDDCSMLKKKELAAVKRATKKMGAGKPLSPADEASINFVLELSDAMFAKELK